MGEGGATICAVGPFHGHLDVKSKDRCCHRTVSEAGLIATALASYSSTDLEATGIGAADVDTVVTISSTGIATPSLRARAATRCGFRADVERVPIFGLGCAGGVSGFSIASRLARSRRQRRASGRGGICTIAFRLDLLTKANIVASALFGDGAAACVLRADEAALQPSRWTANTHGPNTLDIMGSNVEPQGLGVIFDRAIPPFVSEHIAPAVAGILGRAG